MIHLFRYAVATKDLEKTPDPFNFSEAIHAPARRLVRREWACADKLLEQLNHFTVAGNFFDGSLVIFGHERCGLFSGEFLVFLVKFGVPVSFTKRLPQDLYPIPRRAGRQNKGRTGQSESALKLNELALSLGFGKGLKLGDLRQPGMLFSLGDFQNGVDVHQAFFKPVGVSEERLRADRADIDLAASKGDVKLTSRIAGNEFRLL